MRTLTLSGLIRSMFITADKNITLSSNDQEKFPDCQARWHGRSLDMCSDEQESLLAGPTPHTSLQHSSKYEHFESPPRFTTTRISSKSLRCQSNRSLPSTMSAQHVFAANNVALITGGASGIGLAIARLCASHGMRLALVDSNADNLAAAGTEFGDKAHTYGSDVSLPEAWTAIKADVTKRFGSVDLLVLNAARSLQGGWADGAYFRQTLETNLFGVVNGLNAFVPLLQARPADKPSAVVLTGSKQGITNPPGNPAYNISKAAVKTMAEQLAYELRGSPTSVHLLVPGWTFTGMTAQGATGAAKQVQKEKPAGAWTAEQVAQRLEAQVKKRHDGFWCICPDNDIDEATDKKRILWSAGDAVYDRPPLSRWRDEYKDEAAKWMAEQKF
ncbi:hypothetical protein FH972_023250 [Carpinus fangiana]|uniref:NAD-dependent epimerase/dehydratase domain-containing protein n=1 Tax=Carpinus fangiana TaxID=176857 RepID=A0A5N6KWX2_9ROSI|nr:hypothetical protein FH972_023250 [Carpinus fangiana]